MARGGKRSGAGRPKGAKDKATADQIANISELARSHSETAINVLVSVAQSSESDAARVSAANGILDRGYGKPTAIMEHSGPQGGPIVTENKSELELARRVGFLLVRGDRASSQKD